MLTAAAIARLVFMLLAFAWGMTFGVWWSRSGWRRGYNTHRELQQRTLDRMNVVSANEYVLTQKVVAQRSRWKERI